MNYASGGKLLKYCHGFSNLTTGTDKVVRPTEECPCCLEPSKVEYAQIMTEFLYHPSKNRENFNAVAISFEAIEFALQHEDEERFSWIKDHPIKKFYDTTKRRFIGVPDKEIPVYNICWRSASEQSLNKPDILQTGSIQSDMESGNPNSNPNTSNMESSNLNTDVGASNTESNNLNIDPGASNAESNNLNIDPGASNMESSNLNANPGPDMGIMVGEYSLYDQSWILNAFFLN